ncbi:MAG TPA: hypothetical protein PK961_10645 [bacterium]|nr:hypothetical protein [bacterium]
MKKIPTLSALLTLILLLTGCYEVDLRVRVFETGEGLLTHAVKLPTVAYNMRLSSMQTDTATLTRELQESTAADVAAIEGLTLAGVAVIAESNKTVIERQLLFADGQALSAYLTLLGLEAKLLQHKTLFCRRTKGFDFTLHAERIDLEKIVRIGRYYEASPSGMGENQQALKASSLTVAVNLPGALATIEPDTRRDEGTYAWSVTGEQYEQPLDVRLAVQTAKAAPLAMLDQPPTKIFAASATGDEAAADFAAFARRLGGRFMPVLHARLDKKGRVDLSLLWLTDEIGAGYGAYHRRVDEMLLPEIAANYFTWMEVVAVDGQNRLAAGYRSRRPFEVEQLQGMFSIAKDGSSATFFTPRVDTAQADGERPAMAVKVTFADGRQAQYVVRAKELTANTPILLRP